jgi:ABC-type Mn2+/Zn2+ transport system permease subunit
LSTLLEILRPSFLLRDAVVASVLVGLVCPLVGVYFVLRRMIFFGVALPQVSAAGIALSFLTYRMLVGAHQHGEVPEQLLAMVGSFGLTLLTLLLLVSLERTGREMIEARIGTTYAIAAAATILFLAQDPAGEAHMVSLLKGDILAATATSLRLMVYVFAPVVFVLFAFRKQLLLVSFDRDMSIVLGMRVAWWDALLYLTIGATIALGVMTAGPLVTFGFLVVPPLTARLLTRRMLTFSIAASLIGGATSFAGFYCAYRFDLPLGPAEVALASVVLMVVALGAAALRSIRRGSAR